VRGSAHMLHTREKQTKRFAALSVRARGLACSACMFSCCACGLIMLAQRIYLINPKTLRLNLLTHQKSCRRSIGAAYLLGKRPAWCDATHTWQSLEQ